MKVLISAYACEPELGSEPGAGYALVRAAAQAAECWVLTRTNNVASLQRAFDHDPTPYPVHVVPVDARHSLLRVKRRVGSVRAYYVLWQRLAGRIAVELDSSIGFDLVHHATMSAFWLPIGVMDVPKPLVVGPVSGGTLTPRVLLGFLGLKGLALDAARWGASRLGGLMVKHRWRESVSVILAQNEQMRVYAEKVLLGPRAAVVVHSHASNPMTPDCVGITERVPEVLFVGRLVRWKGVSLALKAFARAKVPHARMTFIGAGEARGLLTRRIRREGLADRVGFAGTLEHAEVLRRMCSASALLFPSFHDSAGFVVSEALSLGLPVVCLDHGGPGFLTKLWPEAPQAAVRISTAARILDELSEAIQRFVDDPVPVSGVATAPTVDLKSVIAEAYHRALAAQTS